MLFSEDPNQFYIYDIFTSWAEVFSDHAQSFFFDQRSGLHIMVWNILTQCRKRKTHYNNGFGKIESDSEFLLRQERIAKEIAYQIADKKLDMICLQEVQWPRFQAIVLNYLPSNWVYHSHLTRGTDFYHVSLYDGDKYYSTSFEAINELLVEQKGRVFPLQMFRKYSAMPFLALLNTHLNPKYPVREEIENLLKSYTGKAPLLMAGDFNSPIAEIISLVKETHLNFATQDVAALGKSFTFNMRLRKHNPSRQLDGFLLSSPIK